MTVLFVDDEPHVLRQLERQLIAEDVDWDCDFATSGEQAIEMLATAKYDAVVTDMRMPGMDGAALLNYVSKHYPNTVRIVLSKPSDRDAVLRSIMAMHQFLPKPCDALELRTTIDRACALRDVLISDSLQRLVGGLSRLPSVPAVYRELTNALRNEDASISSIGQIVAKDAVMTAKVLQLVNSAIFCLSHHISDPIKAVSLLGASTLKSLVLAIGIFQEFEALGVNGFSAEVLMQHCLRVSRMTKLIGRRERLDSQALEDAITAATLHDIGKLVLHSIDPKTCAQAALKAEIDDIPLWRAERQIFGADHAAIGAHLLSVWGLPQTIIEIVALHHTPTKAYEMSFSPLTAVVASNFLSRAGSQLPLPTPDDELIRYFEMVVCGEKLESWHNLCSDVGKRNDESRKAPLPQDVSL
ncbi:response regulator [Stieleria sp. ICT_E10.1]|uniref:response regulator n=1 Tax=Stieleria sedimenti TaxID=2976331 RepID=UPI0021806D2A|nr:response regulator [Stieleria sedimenti]MCS7470448.1 response regulator [Stieleria sedimenti]